MRKGEKTLIFVSVSVCIFFKHSESSEISLKMISFAYFREMGLEKRKGNNFCLSMS